MGNPGVIRRTISRVKDALSGVSRPSQWLLGALGGGITSSGVAVSGESALRLSTYYACITVLSEAIASLPLQQFVQRGQEKLPDVNHPNYRLIHDQPNPRQTAFEWREQAMVDLCTTGNHAAWLDIGPDGYIRAIWPLRAGRWSVRMRAGELFYTYSRTPDDEFDELPNPCPAWQILHVRGKTRDGIHGMSPITALAESVGQLLAAQEYSGRMFSQGLLMGGYIKAPAKFSDIERRNFLDYLRRHHSTVNNAGFPMLLDAAMEYIPNKLAPHDAQFLELLKLTRQDICGAMRVPPHMVGITGEIKYNSAELMGQEFKDMTLMPWAVRWEQALQRDLLSPRERGPRFFKHNLNAIFRGDMLSRFRGYAIARQWGWESAESIRDLEDRPFVPGLDQFLTPTNMAVVGQNLMPDQFGGGNG